MRPFSQNAAETVASLGEKALLRQVRDWLGAAAPAAPYGMGDDCAVLPPDGPTTRLLTTDSVVLGRHFDESTPPAAAGEKLLKRNLSDIAAMGGCPTEAVLAGLIPRTVRIDWLEAFTRGLAACAGEYGVHIVGGDLAETADDLAFNLTLLGTGQKLLLRSGGRAGDWICVTGQLGGSQLGRHLAFTPRLDEGRHLAAHPAVRAAIDVSDGLAIDLANLLPENCSAELDTSVIPIHPDAREFSASSGHPPLWHALNDGEDHELLFLAAPMSGEEWTALNKAFAAENLAPLSRIGTLVPFRESPFLDAATGGPLESIAGYDHFR